MRMLKQNISLSLPRFGSRFLESNGNKSSVHIPKAGTISDKDYSKMPEQSKLPPFITALKTTMKENQATFQFPGHNRGLAAPSSLAQIIGKWPFLHDSSDIDDLFYPDGPLLEAQNQAAEVFGASKTWFLVGGTTCGVLASIMGTCNPGDVLILPRNCHISAISALTLCGAVPKYIFPDYDCNWDVATSVSTSEVNNAIQELNMKGKKPAAVFITSPTYQGICSNVQEISTLCHSHGVPLIIDEAHGAHFGFHLNLPISALQQGADLVVQSTHKVLLSLTQSSMLHASQNALVNKEKISRCLQMLQSTSPNYLLLASLDATVAQLKENPEIVFNNAIKLAFEAKHRLNQIPGISVLDYAKSDPLRVTVGVHDLGVSGYEAYEFLYNHHKLLPTLTRSRTITLVFTPGTSKEHVERLITGFEHLSSHFYLYKSKKEGVQGNILKQIREISMELTPREAFFAEKRRVNIETTIGMICGELMCPFPPGIPVLIPGEVISRNALDILLQAKAGGAKISGASDPSLKSIIVCDV